VEEAFSTTVLISAFLFFQGRDKEQALANNKTANNKNTDFKILGDIKQNNKNFINLELFLIITLKNDKNKNELAI
jgi:hypothetical protein